jgi:hypothetical protein
MRELMLLENKIIQGQSPSGTDPATVPSIQRLLDVISSILAEEYIMIAKQNPSVFLNNTPRLAELRGCAFSGQGETK